MQDAGVKNNFINKPYKSNTTIYSVCTQQTWLSSYKIMPNSNIEPITQYHITLTNS